MKAEKLLTRDEFREAVFKRDGYKCIFCPKDAKDAHHILERRLFNDGGYYLSNGASVCEEHHLACEKTLISVDDVRTKLEITSPTIPEHFYSDEVYTKWGDIVLPNGQRTKGELFYDESVQKILKDAGVLSLYTDYVKYPRTYHLPFSPGVNDDDRTLKDCSNFEGKRVIVTEKMDGEQTSMYRDYIHARSVDGRSHPSRDWVKNLWSTFAHEIPEGWRICGENLFAKHSIRYTNLKSFFYGFSIWNNRNVCLGWDETKEWFDLLGIPVPTIMFDGIFDEQKIRNLYVEKTMWYNNEGYVVRLADQYSYASFKNSIAKYVRKGHVQTTKHWFYGQQIEPNEMEKD
jgi:hypothetical protein